MSKELSFPKGKIRVLLLENIHIEAISLFNNEGFQVESYKGAMSEEELIKKISDFHIIGIRSKTILTSRVLESAHKLLVIGAFCIGTNQIDIKTCNQKGIAIFNAPYSNTRSVVELALGEMILLLRNIVSKSESLHRGIWDKSAHNCYEVRGKTLGIIGYGHIGSQLSVLAESLGMKVVYYDIEDRMPLGNAYSCTDIVELLNQSDVVTLHIDGRKENENYFDSEKFNQLKTGAVFMNLSRGHVVDYEALKQNLISKKIIGASVDVYPEEPKSNDETFSFCLQNIPNVILTPHIGGSTEEAQAAIGRFVPNKILQFINNGSTDGSINLPNIQIPIQKNQHRILHIHNNTSGMLAKINQIIASHQVNITGQFLKTNDHIGYVIIDVENNYSELFIEELKSLENTIKCRLLY